MGGSFTFGAFSEERKDGGSGSSAASSPPPSIDADWLKKLLLCQCSRSVRVEAVSLVMLLCAGQEERQQYFLRYLTVLLEQAICVGDKAEEFCNLFDKFVSSAENKKLLSSKGFLSHLIRMIRREATRLGELEQSPSSGDASQGFAIKFLTDLLKSFLAVPDIYQTFKDGKRGIEGLLIAYLTLKLRVLFFCVCVYMCGIVF